MSDKFSDPAPPHTFVIRDPDQPPLPVNVCVCPRCDGLGTVRLPPVKCPTCDGETLVTTKPYREKR